jgi:hypothetical protein
MHELARIYLQRGPGARAAKNRKSVKEQCNRRSCLPHTRSGASLTLIGACDIVALPGWHPRGAIDEPALCWVGFELYLPKSWPGREAGPGCCLTAGCSQDRGKSCSELSTRIKVCWVGWSCCCWQHVGRRRRLLPCYRPLLQQRPPWWSPPLRLPSQRRRARQRRPLPRHPPLLR